MYSQVARFAIAGAIATVFSMLSFPIIYEELFGRDCFSTAYILSCAFNVSLSFGLQRFFVFKSKENLVKEFARFVFGAVFLMLIGYVLVYLFVEYMAFNSYLVNIVVVAFISVASFLWHKLITFGVKS